MMVLMCEPPKKVVDRVKINKTNRMKGGDFERRTQKFLMKEGWLVTRCSINVDVEKEEVILSKYMRFNRYTGFPDFIASRIDSNTGLRKVIGVECKSGRGLSVEERKKCEILKQHKSFDKIVVAYPRMEGRITRVEFKRV